MLKNERTYTDDCSPKELNGIYLIWHLFLSFSKNTYEGAVFVTGRGDSWGFEMSSLPSFLDNDS
jgi:hypothetical protein